MKNSENALDKNIIGFLRSPIALLSAVSLIIISSSRLSYAIISSLSVIWMYCISVIVINCSRKIFPLIYNNLLSVCLFSVLGSVYYLVLYLLNPFLALETELLITLTSILCFSSGINERVSGMSLKNSIYRAIYESVVIGIFLLALSLVRETLGFGALSIPGGDYAIYELFNFDMYYPLPVRIIASSAGALLFLGYIFIVFKFIDAEKDEKPPKEQM
jgi:hypothetical protein